jgi:hypothetical protein
MRGLATATAEEGGLVATVSVVAVTAGLAGAVGRLAVAATGPVRGLVAVVEAATHHLHAGELVAHALGRVFGVSLGPGGAASAPVVVGLWDLEHVSFVLWIWIRPPA